VQQPLAPLILSVVAITVSVVGLIATYIQWLLNGARVVVRAGSGVAAGQLAHPEVLLVLANNSGRTAAWIEQWGFVVKGTNHGPTAWQDGPAVPYRLEGYAEVRWQLDYQEARQNLAANYPNPKSQCWDLVPYVRLGSGDRFIHGRTVLRVWQPGHSGRDPRHSQWWKRWSPWHEEVSFARHGSGWARKTRLPS
jgi:hypothetical protein